MDEIIDRGLKKYVSRKLLVWVAATALVCFAIIPPDMWMSITLAYIGAQGAIDMAVRWRLASLGGALNDSLRTDVGRPAPVD